MHERYNIASDSFAEKFGELARSRADVIESEFPEERMKREFGLNVRESLFVKGYCATFKAHQSALFAGYSKSVANNGSWNMFGKEKLQKARDAILKAVSSATQKQRFILAEKCVAKLSEIIDDVDEKGAVKVSAIESLRKFIDDPPVKVQEEDDNRVDDVSDDEIRDSLKRAGMPYD